MLYYNLCMTSKHAVHGVIHGKDNTYSMGSINNYVEKLVETSKFGKPCKIYKRPFIR